MQSHLPSPKSASVVFAGGWTLASAEVIGAGGDLDKRDVLELLACLVEKSLVAMDPAGSKCKRNRTLAQTSVSSRFAPESAKLAQAFDMLD